MVSQISENSVELFNLFSPQGLLSALQSLRQSVNSEGQATFNQWRSHIQRTEFLSSALNLAQYLALRRHDLRNLQAALMPWGLSSLGRIEARVMPNLDAVIATLEVLCGEAAEPLTRPSIESFFEGDRLLRQHTEALFGATLPHRRVRIMVTLPTEAATDYALVQEIVRRGADCVRINCAHDTPADWQQMIAHLRRAEHESNTCCKVIMDLAGPKIRTGSVLAPPDQKRVFQGDKIVLSRCPSELSSEVESDKAMPSPVDHFQTCCTIPEILDLLVIDAPVYIDDGKIRTRVVETQYPLPDEQSGLLLQVTHASPKGVKLRPEKGLNFPNTILSLSPLTAKDLSDLDFVAAHADMIGYSFVQRPPILSYCKKNWTNALENNHPNPRSSQKLKRRSRFPICRN